MSLHPIPRLPVSNPPPSLIQLKESKFDQLLGDDEGEFTDKILENDFPEDWGDDIREVFDENGWNLLHYSILKGFSNAVQVLVEELDEVFDVNAKTKVDNMTPLKLVLAKCCECIENKTGVEPFYGIAVTLMKSAKAASGADRSVLRFAVNFPVILKGILTHHQDFYKDIDGMPPALTEGIKGLAGENSKMGFIELMLRQNADSIVMDLIDKDPEYVKTYVNTSGETPLHTAAKLGKDEIAKQLMESGLGEYMHTQPDRNHFTPIVTAVFHYKQQKNSAVKVIKEILSHLSTLSSNGAKCIAAIKYPYHGLPVIEYDIKSKEGAIVQGIMKLNKSVCEDILCSESYVLGNIHVNIFHLAARYGFPLQIFKVEDGKKFNLEYLGGQGDDDDKDDYDGEDLPLTMTRVVRPGPTTKPWPCDYAIQYDHIEFLQEAWGYGREEWSHEIKTACRFGNLVAFTFLAAKTKTPLDVGKYQKLLRLTCKHGQASIVKYFLETIGVSPDRQPAEQEKKLPSALMLAADSDAADCVKLLLDHNARVNDVDQKGYNALCRAILIGKKKAVMAILTHPVHGKSALKFCTERTEKTKPNITPMRLLVKHMIDVAKWVLNEQITRDPSTGEIVYKYGLIDDFDPKNCDFAGPLIYLKDVVKTRRAQDDTDTPLPVNAGNGSYNNLGDNDSDKSYNDNPKPTEYEAYNHMLRLMVKSKSLDVLDHVLVGKVINHYWRYVIWQWIILRSIYLFITIVLTAFTLVLPHPNNEICRTSEGGIGGGRRAFLIFSSIILILSALLSVVVSGYTLYVAKLTVFKQTRFRLLFEAILPILILLFVIGYGNDEWCSQRWQWNVGAFCTCLSWLTLLETLKGFRLTAEPINMLFHIIKNFMRLLHVPILLIAAFALPFYMLFTVPGEEHGPYRDIGSTLGTVTILFTGEGDYDGQFNSDQPVSFPFAAYFIYFVFVIMVGILFNNLLTSLAVGEVEDLQANAKLEQYRLNVEGIIDGLEIFFPFIQPKATDRFPPPQGIEHNEEYLEAESEWKKAQEENSEFASSILQDTPDEIVRSKIDQLEATLQEKTMILQQQIQELAEKFIIN